MFDASVIVPVYNRLHALKLTLEGFKRQSVSGFEVIVADDGSKEDVADYLNENKKSFPFRLKHVWQEDKGFRKARISNLATARAESGYMIFSDGDCIPHRDFVKGHIAMREKGGYLVGRSIKISDKISRSLDLARIKKGWLEGVNLSVFYDYVFGGTKFWEYSVQIKSELILKLVTIFKKSKSLFGYNFSAWKEDLIKVNGFNEDFIRPNNEDGELGHRLNNIGLTPRLVLGRAISFHYHHDRSHAAAPDRENIKRSTFAKESGLTRCENGLGQHLRQVASKE